jgi:hypothetical protein
MGIPIEYEHTKDKDLALILLFSIEMKFQIIILV